MGDLYRFQDDGNGNAAEVTFDEAKVETKEQFEQRQDTTEYGATIKDVNSLNAANKATADVIMNGDKFNNEAQVFRAKADAYEGEKLRLAHLEAAGQPVTMSEKTHLLRSYQDLCIMATGLGIDIGQNG